MSTPEARLDALGIELPAPMVPVANYVPYVITGNMLFVSGQVSATPTGRINGRLGEDMELSAGQRRESWRFRQRHRRFHRYPASHQWLLRPHG